MNWRTSTYSIGNGDCIEVGDGDAVTVVRDSKLAESPVLAFPAASWREFAERVKRGRA